MRLPHAARGPLPEVDFRNAAGQPVAAPASDPAERSFSIDPGADASAWLAAEGERERNVLETAASLLLWPPDASPRR